VAVRMWLSVRCRVFFYAFLFYVETWGAVRVARRSASRGTQGAARDARGSRSPVGGVAFWRIGDEGLKGVRHVGWRRKAGALWRRRRRRQTYGCCDARSSLTFAKGPSLKKYFLFDRVSHTHLFFFSQVLIFTRSFICVHDASASRQHKVPSIAFRDM
jgi:hypothetical protein